MALISGNTAMHGARGRLGEIYYRIRYGNQEVCAMPRKSTKPRSPAQLAQQELMALANIYAKQLKTNAEMRTYYEKMAPLKKKTDAYHCAISHFMTSPRLRQVGFETYAGRTGDIIRCQPKAWKEVVSVFVRIKDRLGHEVESGPAEKADYDWWLYTARETVVEWREFTVIFEITDDLGHVGVREAPASP